MYIKIVLYKKFDKCFWSYDVGYLFSYNQYTNIFTYILCIYIYIYIYMVIKKYYLKLKLQNLKSEKKYDLIIIMTSVTVDLQ